ncbi:MAG: 30S ribosomal protein S9 [Crenarchaeota archaeon]|nr:30S ribosomal protein S9 [Thermoproteota archaeon]
MSSGAAPQEARQAQPEVKTLGAYPKIVAGKRIVISVGKRKTAIARAIIRPGNGRFKVNGVPIEIWPIEMARLKMIEPLLLLAPELRNSIDIDVKVEGGGVMAQADAVRMAIARGIVAFFGLSVLKDLYREFDRHMLSGDPRRTEPEKWLRYSARRFRQKSYR